MPLLSCPDRDLNPSAVVRKHLDAPHLDVQHKGVHVPVDVRYFPSGQGDGLFVHAGVRGMGTLATTCVSGGGCPEPEPGELPTTLGGLGGLGLGWQGAFGHGIGLLHRGVGVIAAVCAHDEPRRARSRVTAEAGDDPSRRGGGG